MDENQNLPTQEQEEKKPKMIFGMKRSYFYGLILGYGGGLILAGLAGLLGIYTFSTSSIPGIGGAVIGYFIGDQMSK